MDVFKQIPAISEDTLQYTLHLPADSSDKASATTFAACIRSYADSLLPGFIWHRDAFELKVVRNGEADGWILAGTMRVGDCVDDEWCAVWLLKEISSKWDVPIGVYDSDGEFLLIEAAETLPTWVRPTNSENRVWIYSSHLHLIPLSHTSPPSRPRRRRKLLGPKDSDDEGGGRNVEDDNNFIAAEDAITLVRDASVDTLAPSSVENIVWQRIQRYPAAARDHVHNAKAYIPVDIARSLVAHPSLVQKAVQAFYTRDAIQLRVAHRMSRFPSDPSVLSAVKMTRTAYAQLMGQKFFPPKVFGRWHEKEGSPEWRWRDVGMKIAVGFEMLYQETKSRSDASNINAKTIDASASTSEAQKDALRRSPEYTKYIQNLVSAGYFRGEIEGSGLWRTLESKAAATFVEVRQEDDATRQSFTALVNIALSQVQSLPASESEVEDSDDWLNVDAQDFENMLERTMGASNSKDEPTAMDVDGPENAESYEDRLASEQASKLKELAFKVEIFVQGEGDLEGARFEDEGSSDEEFSDESSQSDSDSEDGAEMSAARQAAMDRLVPGLEPSEYGKMPASFHSSSQRMAPATIETDIVEEAKDTPSNVRSPPRSKPIREPILPRDKYDGVDSDDETDEEGAEEDEESDEDKPQVVGDIDVDMGEEEEEFLEFSRQALGITDEQWLEIVRDRQARGAFVPASAVLNAEKAVKKPPAPGRSGPQVEKTSGGRVPQPGPTQSVNPNLDSFEAVMKAMDEELSRLRTTRTKAGSVPPPRTNKGKGKAAAGHEGENDDEDDDQDQDIEAAMEAELKSALQRDDDEGYDNGESDAPVDYNLIKNFLESFKSQAGLSGPVGNLSGRLQSGWQIPRDEA